MGVGRAEVVEVLAEPVAPPVRAAADVGAAAVVCAVVASESSESNICRPTTAPMAMTATTSTPITIGSTTERRLPCGAYRSCA